MSPSLAGQIEQHITAVQDSYYRLILVVGPSGTGKTTALQSLAKQIAAPLLNLNLELSERIIALAHPQRALRTAELLGEILEGTEQAVVVLDNTEVLFDPALRQDPLRLLQSLSRRRALVAAWGGELDGSDLVYAEPGHPEHRRYPRPEAILVPTTTKG